MIQTRKACTDPRSSMSTTAPPTIQNRRSRWNHPVRWITGTQSIPSLVLNPAANLGIVTEEQFGPSLPIIGYDSEADAVAQANNTWSGLCSSVWSSDLEHGIAIAAQLRTGVTFYNGHNAPFLDERTPFGGFNQSGIGRELGREGLLAFTETHVVAIPAS